MINGIGYSELFVILVLFLLFFGSKELPRLLREAGKLYAKARRYTDTVRQELDSIARVADPPKSMSQEAGEKKKTIRTALRAARAGLPDGDRREKSDKIRETLMGMPKVRDARVVMAYLETGPEVEISGMVAQLIAQGRRVVIPYCKPGVRNLGIAEISSIEGQTAPGEWGIREPVESIRDNFLRSDLQVILCPGVGFDMNGGRLGNGKGYYDNFLRELRGRVPMIGLGFDCQISKDPFPFDYSDIPMDQVVTESGILLKDRDIGMG